ncbi:hypothetical protein JB92DRAFT_2833198 [Gautieria morchelliformis]|nr:hypothetical protein JB92DRAFT_2833198 [Gautieria morchelliformis]
MRRNKQVLVRGGFLTTVSSELEWIGIVGWDMVWTSETSDMEERKKERKEEKYEWPAGWPSYHSMDQMYLGSGAYPRFDDDVFVGFMDVCGPEEASVGWWGSGGWCGRGTLALPQQPARSCVPFHAAEMVDHLVAPLSKGSELALKGVVADQAPFWPSLGLGYFRLHCPTIETLGDTSYEQAGLCLVVGRFTRDSSGLKRQGQCFLLLKNH